MHTPLIIMVPGVHPDPHLQLADRHRDHRGGVYRLSPPDTRSHIYSKRLLARGSERRGRNEIKRVLVDEVRARHLLD